MPAPAPRCLLGVDIGGTFTDLVAFNLEDGQITLSKSSSTPNDLTEGIRSCLVKSGVPLTEVATFFHGTTQVINTVIEKTGAKTGLVTTAGFRDVLEIGRANRPQNYNLFYQKPTPLVPRHLRFEVEERMTPDGEVLVPLTEESVEAVIDAARRHGLEAVAVCLLHAYANPRHEEQVRAALSAALPGVYICESSDIVREWREFERTSTTVMNAYVGPRVERYVARLEAMNGSLGFRGSFLIMQSNGGVMTSDAARRFPVSMVESGPVAGVIGAAYLSTQLDEPFLIAFDMGGTTAKASLIEHGIPKTTPIYYLGGYADGYPLQLPVIEVVEVGTGGGSIAWIDETGALKVGPRSAGAEPGPVCYGKGGGEPTVTDANVALGRVDAARFLGGEMPLEAAQAKAAIRERIAAPFGLEVEEAAAGILTIAESNMSLAVRAITIEKGYDPRDFALMVFGGAGPMHALSLARELAIPRVIIPTMPAHFSALGMVLTDLRRDFVRTCVRPFSGDAFQDLNALLTELKEEGRNWLRAEGVAPKNIACAAFLDLRYVGQEYAVTTPLGGDTITPEHRDRTRAEFDRLYEVRYGHSFSEVPVEVVNARVIALGKGQKPAFAKLPGRGGPAAAAPIKAARRFVYYPGLGFVECPIYDRRSLLGGDRFTGPAIVEEYASTLVLGPGDAAEVNEFGYIVVHVEGAA
ncbi:MAG: hydantoinase/oxoprolinase family protein [Candidatus Tectomicrobia bacterium]|nr:hydantoinase/oxoprolinase family protein [Candidatus Tectomicrobia bacterium]